MRRRRRKCSRVGEREYAKGREDKSKHFRTFDLLLQRLHRWRSSSFWLRHAGLSLFWPVFLLFTRNILNISRWSGWTWNTTTKASSLTEIPSNYPTIKIKITSKLTQASIDQLRAFLIFIFTTVADWNNSMITVDKAVHALFTAFIYADKPYFILFIFYYYVPHQQICLCKVTQMMHMMCFFKLFLTFTLW